MSLQASSEEKRFSFKKPKWNPTNQKTPTPIAIHNLFTNKCTKINHNFAVCTDAQKNPQKIKSIPSKQPQNKNPNKSWSFLHLETWKSVKLSAPALE